MINVKALRATMEKVELAAKLYGPGAWFQDGWRCDTGMCFAGHGVQVAGLVWEFPDAKSDPYVKEPGRLPRHCKIAMKEFYGLTWDEADDLFHPYNSLESLRQMVAAIEVIAAMDPEAIL